MHVADVIELVAALADADRRGEAAENLAHALGAEHALVFLHDADADAMLPAPGRRKTLPGGAEWRDLLLQSRSAGLHRGAVPWAAGQPPSPAVACSENGLALVFVGGDIGNEDAELIRLMIPLLKAALAAQHSLLATAGELQAAQSEIRQAAALMQALDETRSQLDRSLLERDWQAQSLELARAQAEQATRSKDEFMAMLGHELRNPLAPIKTALDLLKMRGIWSMEHDVMQRQVGHMIRLVDDLLDVSRIAGGKLTMDRAPTQVSTVISRAMETVSPMAITRRQKINVNVPAGGLCVFGDAARLAQVFSNLLTNASKYSDADSAIDISAWQDGSTIRVRIQDQGIGIDPSMLDDVFELFHQQGRGIDRAQGGLGLGLAIVRNLVTLHDGKVEAQSAGPGGGSSFVVSLPACKDHESRMAALPLQTGISKQIAGKHGRILLVDDNADARETLAGAFIATGHEVRTAADAFEALKRVEEFHPDVAVLDIGLPVMDGYELAERLRRREGRPIKLVALTGYGQPEDKARAHRAGFLAHFAKPVDFVQLLATLDTLLDPLAPLVGANVAVRSWANIQHP